MLASDFLIEAGLLIKEPHNWVTGTTQATRQNPRTGEDVVAYCSSGALSAVRERLTQFRDGVWTAEVFCAHSAAERFLDKCCPSSHEGIVGYNDSLSHLHLSHEERHMRLMAWWRSAVREARLQEQKDRDALLVSERWCVAEVVQIPVTMSEAEVAEEHLSISGD